MNTLLNDIHRMNIFTTITYLNAIINMQVKPIGNILLMIKKNEETDNGK